MTQIDSGGDHPWRQPGETRDYVQLMMAAARQARFGGSTRN